MQADVPAAVNVEGEQLRPDNPAAAARLIEVLRVTPLSEAVTVVDWLTAIEPAVTLNDAPDKLPPI